MPTGNLMGWLRLMTKADLDKLSAGSSGRATPPPPVIPGADETRRGMEGAGIVLGYAGAEQRGGVDTDHLHATIDLDKVLDSPMADSLTRVQIGQMRAAAAVLTISFDLWSERPPAGSTRSARTSPTGKRATPRSTCASR